MPDIEETKRLLPKQDSESNERLKKEIKLHFLQKLLTLNQDSVVRDVTQQSDLFKIPAENKEEPESTNITSHIYRELNTIENIDEQNSNDQDIFYCLVGSRGSEEKSSVLNVDVYKKINGLKNKLLENHVTPPHSINLGDWAVLCSADFTFQNQLITEFDLTQNGNFPELMKTLKVAYIETWASLLAQLERNQSPIDPNSLTITSEFQAIIETEIATATTQLSTEHEATPSTQLSAEPVQPVQQFELSKAEAAASKINWGTGWLVVGGIVLLAAIVLVALLSTGVFVLKTTMVASPFFIPVAVFAGILDLFAFVRGGVLLKNGREMLVLKQLPENIESVIEQQQDLEDLTTQLLSDPNFFLDRPSEAEIKLLFLAGLLTLRDPAEVDNVTQAAEFISRNDKESGSPHISITAAIYHELNDTKRAITNNGDNDYRLKIDSEEKSIIDVQKRIHGLKTELQKSNFNLPATIRLGDEAILASADKTFGAKIIDTLSLYVRPYLMSDDINGADEGKDFSNDAKSVLTQTWQSLLPQLEDTPPISCSASGQFAITPEFQQILKKEILKLKEVLKPLTNKLEAYLNWVAQFKDKTKELEQAKEQFRIKTTTKQSKGKVFLGIGLFIFLAALVLVGLLSAGVVPAIAALIGGHFLTAAAVTAAVGMGTAVISGLYLRNSSQEMARIEVNMAQIKKRIEANMAQIENSPRLAQMKERLNQAAVALASVGDLKLDSDLKLPKALSSSDLLLRLQEGQRSLPEGVALPASPKSDHSDSEGGNSMENETLLPQPAQDWTVITKVQEEPQGFRLGS